MQPYLGEEEVKFGFSLFALELGNSMAVDRKQVLASVSLSIAKLIISLFLSRTIHK